MKLNITHLLQTIILFILMTIIGTLSHEFGHILVAKYYGYQTELHYGSMTTPCMNPAPLKKIIINNLESIKQKKHFPQENEYKKLLTEQRAKLIKISCGGPLQTILTGTIGFILLLLYRKKDNWKQWLLIYLTLFWTREVFNFLQYLINSIILGKNSRGDEMKIAQYYGFPEWSIISIFAIIGFIICSYTIFFIVPKSKRNSFILGGLVGGILGFYLWMKQIGPILLP